MRYFIDSEFVDNGKTIDLISIGIVAEDGRELYMQSVNFNPHKASDWVKENVFLWLKSCPHKHGSHNLMWQLEEHQRAEGQCTFSDLDKRIIGAYIDCPWRSRNQIAHEVFTFMNVKAHGTPELWGWCAAYDFVALCQIFGTMMDLPQGWPHYIRDVQYLLDEQGIADSELPPSKGTAHNALADAKQIKVIWEMLQSTSIDRQAWEAYKSIEPRYSEANRRLAHGE